MNHSIPRNFSFLIPLLVLSACCQPPTMPKPPMPVMHVPTPMSPCPSGPDGQGNIIEAVSYPTGDPATSFLCLQKVAPEEVLAGEAFTYQLRITNTSPNPIDGVSVVDRAPPGFSVQSSSPPSTGGGGSAMSWAIGRINPGETKSISITGTAGATGTLVNCAELHLDPAEVCATTRVIQPSLQLTKEGPAEAMACDMLTYTVTVTNTGSGMAREIRIEDNLPEGLTTLDGSRTASFMVPELAGGESRSFPITARAANSGTYTNSATASAKGGISTASNSVTTRVTKPALDIALNCPGTRFGGQVVEYNVAVTNTGTGVCNSTVVESTIPGGCGFESASDGGSSNGGKVVWMVGALNPGETRNMTYSVRCTQLGTKTATATATCVCSDPATTTCTTEVKGIPAVLLEVIDTDDPVPVGGQTTYIITVTNQGSLADTNIALECVLESEMEFVSSSGATMGTHSGGTITFAPLPSLAPKDRAEWRVVVRAVAAGDTRFSVSMRTDELNRQSNRPVEETEATNLYQ